MPRTDPVQRTSSADTLNRLHALPAEALFTPEEAGIYLNARIDLLRAWRWQGRGPAFVGRGHFVRYPKQNLNTFLAGHVGAMRPEWTDSTGGLTGGHERLPDAKPSAGAVPA